MTKQTLLIIGALLLIAHISFSVSNSVGDMPGDDHNSDDTFQTAANIAQLTINEVSSKAFDEKSVTGRIASLDSLTSPFALGPDVGEGYSDFDDVDDFKGYSRTIPTERWGNFTVNVDVVYAVEPVGGAAVSYCTFIKEIVVVVVGNAALQYPVKMTAIVKY